MVSYAIYPRFQYITDISNAKTAVVTTLSAHDFTDGEIVSLRVTKDFGMFEANEKEVRVLDHGSTTLTVDLDTTNYTPFVYPTLATKYTPPVVVPSASGIIPGTVVATMNLEDSFDNRRT